MKLHVIPTVLPPAAILTLAGELDIAETLRLSTIVDGVLREGGLSIVLDLAGVTFMDTAGLTALVRASQRVQHAGGELSVVSVSPQVARVLALVGPDQLRGQIVGRPSR